MNICVGPAGSIIDDETIVQEIEFEGIKINAGCSIVYGSAFRAARGLFSLIDEPGITFRILSSGPSSYSIQSLTTYDELRHRENSKPQFSTFELINNEWICNSVEYYYNDKMHRIDGPAYIYIDYDGKENLSYRVHDLDVTHEVLTSGYQDGSPELEMLLSLVTPKTLGES